MKLSPANGSAVLAAILWALGSIMTKHLLSQFGPIDLLAIELATSTLSLWAMLAFVPWQAPSISACLRLASPGFLQPGLAYLLSFIGLQWTSASLETLSAAQAIGSPIALAAISALSFQQNKTEVEPF